MLILQLLRTYRKAFLATLPDSRAFLGASGLTIGVTTMLANARVDVLAVNTLSDKEENTAAMKLTVEIASLEALGILLAKINRLPNVLNAIRVKEGE